MFLLFILFVWNNVISFWLGLNFSSLPFFRIFKDFYCQLKIIFTVLLFCFITKETSRLFIYLYIYFLIYWFLRYSSFLYEVFSSISFLINLIVLKVIVQMRMYVYILSIFFFLLGFTFVIS